MVTDTMFQTSEMKLGGILEGKPSVNIFELVKNPENIMSGSNSSVFGFKVDNSPFEGTHAFKINNTNADKSPFDPKQIPSLGSAISFGGKG